MSVSSSVTNASNGIILRLILHNQIGVMANVTNTISEAGGNIGAIDIVRPIKDGTIRDFSINASDPEHALKIVEAVRKIEHVEYVKHSDRTFLVHLGGKIEVVSKVPLKTRDDLSMAYTPGVARVCQAIADDPKEAYNLTIKRNMVAVVTDGTAVLGLGDIGPEASMPVMEGKAQLFKQFGDVDAFPIALATKDTEEIIATVKNIAPGFGGINLEDISAPRCFEIEKRLKAELDIPVFHDDQHGTAIVATAALINALKLVKKEAKDIKVVVMGVGAAGTACSKMIMDLGVTNIIGCDRKGAIYKGRDGLNKAKMWYADNTNPNGEQGNVHDIIKGADVFLGLSAPGMINIDDLKNMGTDPILFAMANPTPEIMPEEAQNYATVIATGRSDYPNQINNVLCFPGIFRGALDCNATSINEPMKMAVATAIASCISDEHLQPDYIIPSVFDKTVAPKVSLAVQKAAIETNVAGRSKVKEHKFSKL